MSDVDKKVVMKGRFESLLSKYNVKENSSLLICEKSLHLIAEVKKSKIANKKVLCDY